MVLSHERGKRWLAVQGGGILLNLRDHFWAELGLLQRWCHAVKAAAAASMTLIIILFLSSGRRHCCHIMNIFSV